MGLEAWLTDSWYGGRRARPWLLPFSWLYGGAVRIRRLLYRAGLLRAGGPEVPTVVVGNITAGGTGKTPLVIFLVERLLAAGRRPGVASRGYGGTDTDSPRRVDARSAPEEVGDEPVLIARRTGVPVVVCRDRRAAAQRLAEEGVELVICDDGLQHYGLRRDAELVVIDGERGLGNGHLLPAGPLREPPGRLREADLIIRNGGTPTGSELGMRLLGKRAVHLATGRSRPLDSLAGEVWHAVAGIGNPERFFRALDAAGLYVIRHPLPDHARFDERSLPAADGYPVLMTEKDAVKCAATASDRLWYLPVDASFEDADAARLLDAVLTACGQDGEH